jgi:hypothetical protein
MCTPHPSHHRAFLTTRHAPPPFASHISKNTTPDASSIPCSSCPQRRSPEPLEAHDVTETTTKKPKLVSCPRRTRPGPSYLSKQRAPCETCELGLNDPESEKKLDGKESKTPTMLERVKRVSPGQIVSGIRFLFKSNLTRIMPTLHRDINHAHAHASMPNRQRRRYRRFIFLVLPSPKKGGGVTGGSGRAAAAAKIHSCHSSISARQGKRDKYR